MAATAGGTEFHRRPDLEQLQLERLQSTLNRACKNVPFYYNRFQDAGIDPGAVRDLTDLQSLPFTTRDDLSRNYPYGLFAVPLRDIVRIHSAPGTGLQPTVSGYTHRDVGIWREMVGRCLRAAGIGATDIIQICFDPGLANWARDFKDGAEAVQASVIPMTPLEISKQVMIMSDYKTTVLVTTPSYARQLAKVMIKMGVNPNLLSLQRLVLIGEAVSLAARAQVEERLHVVTYLAYGLSEVPGPAIGYECEAREGVHLSEDHFLAEIIDPETGAVLGPGEVGELVLTTLTAKACPLIRFRTGDRGMLQADLCRCGRVFRRLTLLPGRTDEIVVIRGIKVHPRLLNSIIDRLGGSGAPRHVAFVTRQEELDVLEIWLEVADLAAADEIKVLEAVVQRVRLEVEQSLGIPARVRLVEPSTMRQQGQFCRRLVDWRLNG